MIFLIVVFVIEYEAKRSRSLLSGTLVKVTWACVYAHSHMGVIDYLSADSESQLLLIHGITKS